MRAQDSRYIQLRRAVGQRHGPTAQRLLDDAYDIAAIVHDGQYRASGDPYILHPLEVAWLVTNCGQPFVSTWAALLHDVSDGLDDLDPIRERVGNEVVDLVIDVCALDSGNLPIDFGPEQPLHSAAVIKLADRLHNARTWRFIPVSRAEFKARQDLAIYTQAASQVGLPRVAEELESLATATLQGFGQPARRSRCPSDGTAGGRLRFCGWLGRGTATARSLPPAASKRHRYFEEWAAELLATPNTPTQVAMALGINYSAGRMRRRLGKAASQHVW